ncbi:splicing factor, arginine/serine-rich [Pimephales promelas]|nr:splicing factor, arginine/serine-rich [Pimephales promelas]
MSRHGRHAGETKVYVGNLGTGAGKGELERAFGYYGPLRTVWIARNPPGFAFVEFEDPRDAEDAVRGLDGNVICGSRTRVELSTGMPRRSRYERPPTRRPFDPSDRCYECGEKGHYAYDCHRYSRRRRSRYSECDPSTAHLLMENTVSIPFTLSLSVQREEIRALPQPQQREKVQVFLSSAFSLWFSQALQVRDAQTLQVHIPLSLPIRLRSQEQVWFSREVQIRLSGQKSFALPELCQE